MQNRTKFIQKSPQNPLKADPKSFQNLPKTLPKPTQSDDGTPCKLAEWIYFLICNRENNQTWDRWCTHLVACIIDRTHNLVPREECQGIRLHDGTAFGPSHCRILFSSLEKYMGGHELARCIFDRGVPKIFDYQNVSRTTTNTKRELLFDAWDWWMRFLRDYIMEEHLRPLENHDIFRETECPKPPP